MSDYSNAPDPRHYPQGNTQPQDRPVPPNQGYGPGQTPVQPPYQGQQPAFRPQQPPYPGPQPPYPYQPQRRKGLGAGAIVAIVIGALVVAGALAWLGFRYMAQKGAEEYAADFEETEVVELPTSEVNEEFRSLGDCAADDFAWLSQRRVRYEDISGLSSADKRILRNAIYARHGYIFKSADLRDYFSRYAWYTPRYADVSGQLSEIERDNVMFIKSYE